MPKIKGVYYFSSCSENPSGCLEPPPPPLSFPPVPLTDTVMGFVKFKDSYVRNLWSLVGFPGLRSTQIIPKYWPQKSVSYRVCVILAKLYWSKRNLGTLKLSSFFAALLFSILVGWFWYVNTGGFFLFFLHYCIIFIIFVLFGFLWYPRTILAAVN